VNVEEGLVAVGAAIRGGTDSVSSAGGRSCQTCGTTLIRRLHLELLVGPIFVDLRLREIMSNKSSNSNHTNMDPKLLHLVRKLLESNTNNTERSSNNSNNNNSNVSSDSIVTILRTNHREYQRKDATKLRVAVQQVVQHLQQSKQQQQQQAVVEQEDAEYDRHAAQHDALAASQATGLNASLRNRYQQQQQQRDNEAQLAPLRDTTTASAAGTATPSKRLKLKRSSSRRSSSGLGGGASAGVGADLGGGGGGNDSSFSMLQPLPRPTERYANLGGMSEIVQTVRQLVEYPITRPELYRHLGVDPPRGVLLRGPPGT